MTFWDKLGIYLKFAVGFNILTLILVMLKTSNVMAFLCLLMSTVFIITHSLNECNSKEIS